VAMRKNGLPEITFKAVINIYEGAKTKIRVRSGLSKEFFEKVGVHQCPVLPPFLFAMVVDEVKKIARKGWIKEILYTDDLVLAGESMDELRENFDQWIRSFESKGTKINLGKTKPMVNGIDEKIFLRPQHQSLYCLLLLLIFEVIK